MSAARTRHIDALIAVARTAFAASNLRSLSLSKPLSSTAPAGTAPADTASVDTAPAGAKSAAATGAEKIMLRPMQIKGAPHLTVLYRFANKDITKNLAPEAAWQSLTSWLHEEFANAHLLTDTQDVQLITSRKGASQLLRARVAAPASAAPVQHDRAKAHLIDLDVAFLQPLGITQQSSNGPPILVPAMANKYKQINKFLEIFHTALAKSQVADKRDLRVLDFGAGKGYLTFAIDHYLSARNSTPAHAVLGVELRAELVDAGNAICESLATRATLKFVAGDVRTCFAVSPCGETYASNQLDVMVALHACDTATDHAIHFGIRQQAAVILCSPCCHKQLRPQIKLPQVLAPLLQHGVHLGQEAEMLTDGLRALLLEAAGYQTQVFEFIATEHTAKNKMILAIRRKVALPALRIRELNEQIATLKAFYGVREHCLDTLLASA